jgi:DNA-binding transcriptional regulator GbsR (MarR family)
MDAFERACVDLFTNAASSLSVPRSVGEIYGLLFSTEEPLSLDDVMERLQSSRGSMHEGLRWLRTIGAIRKVSVPGEWKAHFTAETSLRRIAAGYIRDRIEPHLGGQNRLHDLEKLAGAVPERESFQRGRINQVTNWHKFLTQALPAIKALPGKF